MILQTSKISPSAQTWLSDEIPRRVLHVFERACNLIDEKNEVLSIVDPTVNPGPFSIVVLPALEEGFTRRINITTPVVVESDQILLGDLKIDTHNAEHWDPSPDWGMIRTQRERLFHRLMSQREIIAKASTKESFFHLIMPTRARENLSQARSNSLDSLALEKAFAPTQLLCEGIIANNLIAVGQAAMELAGLGSGLTPAGDDFMTGALIASRIILSPGASAEIAEVVIEAALPRTNVLSAAYLKAAAKGEIHHDWIMLFQTLLSANSSGLPEVLKTIVGWGHTSGADTLGGFIGVQQAAQHNLY
jgi:hypothetical protein